MNRAALLAFAFAAASAPLAAYAEVPPPKEGTLPQKPLKPLTAEDMGKLHEYNIPSELYITGDPPLLNKTNMNMGKRVSFVSCPYIRDSEPTPLWLTEHKGETYFLRAQQNMSAQVDHPQLNHKVLVEGVISDEPRVAGGVVLAPLSISVLPEVDVTCNRKLPADGSKVAFAKRRPGPSGSAADHRAATIGRQQRTARLWATEYTPDPVDRKTKEFAIIYTFDNDLLNLNYRKVVEVVKYARDVEASKIEIVGYRGSAKLSDGTMLTEKPGLEEIRAKSVASFFHDFPIPKETIHVRWESAPRPADGVTDFATRYVSIVVTPGPVKARQTAARE